MVINWFFINRKIILKKDCACKGKPYNATIAIMRITNEIKNIIVPLTRISELLSAYNASA
jgi:hypothetical protein